LGANVLVAMTILFENRDMRVIDYVCRALPTDAPFEEVHERYSLSFVRRGSFGCTARGHRHELVVGGYFVGALGDSFVCTHDHHQGDDECLSFQLSAALVDEIGGDRGAWLRVSVPPLASLVAVGALAQSVAAGLTDLSIGEIGMRLTAHFVDVMRGVQRERVQASDLDRRRSVRAAAWLDENCMGPVHLDDAAREAGLSPFHFLRVFSNVIEATPNQFLISCRLRRAVELLTHTDDPVTEVALNVGFADLSNFQRSFRRATGVSPGKFRKLAAADRKILQVRLASRSLV
jgi:AraC family transcriptional regulator